MIRFVDKDNACIGEIYDDIDSMLEKIHDIIQAKEQDPEENFYSEVKNVIVKRLNKMTTPLHLLAYALNPKYYNNEIVGRASRQRPYDDREVTNGTRATFRSYGEDYVVKGIRKFANKVKNAQEAHEAIRPTDIRRSPSMLAGILDKDLLKLYTLIWCQTMACQMQEAKISQISACFGNEEKSVILRSTGSAISFPGYLAVFQDNETLITQGYEIHQEEDGDFPYLSELKDKELISKGEEIQEKEEGGNFSYLSELKTGDLIYINEVQPLQHFTEPPPRYSEGSLIEKMEELGIGRPSTYAFIIKTLEAREYISIRSRRIFPEFRGQMVSKFLSHYFPETINLGFTAHMESQLDDIATGCGNWKNVLSKFWESFHPVCERVSKVDNKEVKNMLAETFEDQLFGAHPEKNRTCPECKTGTLKLRVTRHGAGYFIGCDAFPQCSYTSATLVSEEEKQNRKEETQTNMQPKLLGTDPNSDLQVFLKHGPYGYYVQLGEDTKDWKPKRASISKIKDIETIKLENALELLRYPIILGKHPEDKKPVLLARMKYGFAIRHRHLIATVPK
ncbi:hypothetical protein KI387_015355, partial [Taxus chinensis]